MQNIQNIQNMQNKHNMQNMHIRGRVWPGLPVIFQQRCDTDYFWKSLTSPSSRLFSLTIGNDYFGIILLILGPIILGLFTICPPHFRPKVLLMSSFIRINLQTDSVKCIFTPFPGPRHMLTETCAYAHIRTNRICQYADYAHIENICAYGEIRNRICAYPHETS